MSGLVFISLLFPSIVGLTIKVVGKKEEEKKIKSLIKWEDKRKKCTGGPVKHGRVFWYRVKSELSRVRYCTRVHWTSHFSQGIS